MNNPLERSNYPGQPYAQQREVPRYTLIAIIDIIEPVNDVRISGRVSEISRKGCYVDILNTLPKHTPVRVVISRDRGTFSSAAKIIYVQEHMGMGVAFVDSRDDQLKVLDAWLAELKEDKQ